MSKIKEILESNSSARYYSEIGSYRGAVKMNNKWVSVSELNRINKSDWTRWQGPPSEAISTAMKQKPIRADILLPNRRTENE